MVVVSVHVLYCLLKEWQKLCWLFPQLLTQLVVEVLQVVQRDPEHVDVLLRISLQLFAEESYGEFAALTGR
jgi:hypothetical protein